MIRPSTLGSFVPWFHLTSVSGVAAYRHPYQRQLRLGRLALQWRLSELLLISSCASSWFTDGIHALPAAVAREPGVCSDAL